MRVTLQYFDGCPNWKEAEQRVVAALREAGLQGVDIELETVDTQQRAEQQGFVGSPTILVDGQDPFAGAKDPRRGLTCRVFETPEGLRGAPSLGQLTEVFRRSAVRQ
ncbi:MAG: thioredoxin family protein [Actinobacteria bacterium]|nr:thioredoxin family protein [Actinomycetota bacterium]